MKKILASIAVFLLGAIVVAVSLPPPRPAVAQFVGQQTYAGTSTNSGNAYSITVANMTSLVSGVPIQFIPNATNTGPTTLNVSGIGATTVQRPSSIGLTGLSGGEFTSGVLVTVIYNGSNFQIVSPVNQAPIGSTVDFRGASAPTGYLIEDGSAVSRTTYAGLFSVIGTTYGIGDGTNTFNLPDSRGSLLAALDNQGSNGAANRITSGGSGCTATALSSSICGSQNQTLTLAQLPTGITSVNASQSITVNPAGSALNIVPYAAGTWANLSAGPGANNVPQSNANGSIFSTGTFSGTNSISVTSNNTSGSAHPILPPVSLVRRAIKY